jgi:transposase-like protein
MSRKPRVERFPEEKWQIVQEVIKSGNVSETCRRHGIAPNLFYRWKDEAEQAALGGRSAAAAETEKDHRIRQLERTLGRKSLEIEILKKRRGGVSCGEVHSQAREMMTQGYTATWLAATPAISRLSLYYRRKPRGSWAVRTYDEPIVVACGEKSAHGYRRVTWWLRRKENLPVNRKRVMRERGLLVGSRRLRERPKKEWGRVDAAEPNQIWQSDMTEIWAGPAVG